MALYNVSINYTILGLGKYEVFHHHVNETTRVEDILRSICPNELDNSDFWLVSEITIPNHWIKRQPTFV
jgi:hypothetical protein